MKPLAHPAAPARPSALALPLFLLIIMACWAGARPALAFCGFYVAKADAKLFNQASQVVLVRDEDRTVMTMDNDFKGDAKEFAVVIPVPTFIERGQIHVAERALIDHLDAYSAPRLVEYYDPDPCQRWGTKDRINVGGYAKATEMAAAPARARSLGVTVEATYTVGEYDIVILSAKQSDGLEIWLRESGYQIPQGAARALGAYIKQGMHFFVAKVNLKEQGKLGFTYLRPIQVAYESPRFMLPIRLGMVNAAGPQELFVYALTRKGRVETTNYRTVRLPTGEEVPLFVKNEFGPFYKAMFSRQVRKEEMRTVFLEYAWDMGWCDPCAADPLSAAELHSLGVFWLGDSGPAPAGGARGKIGRPGRPPGFGPAPVEGVFLTRLHVRYDAAHFPEDLVFQETGDNENFQGRYVLRYPWTGTAACEAAAAYRRDLATRQRQEAQTLAELTDWDVAKIRRKMNLRASGSVTPPDEPWWKRIWQ
ncbi:MAG TPA: DUF2330 domain-containing protein [Thermoanaerobaculia bacterium]|nr:DUF2330 domain-containing protein [Thermoanaerobaculia bacterium]